MSNTYKPKEPLLIVKVGGKVVENPTALQKLIKDFVAIKCKKLLVHGGGSMATKVAEKLGVKTTMVEGRRVTDNNMIDIVTMVYGGLVNKRLVALLQWHKLNAIGLTGADMNVMLSDKRPIKTVDYGWVGDVRKVSGKALSDLIDGGYLPVLAPITHDGKGHILNTNADTIAGEAAKALASRYDVTLAFCFEKNGVLMNDQDDDSVIEVLKQTQFAQLKDMGIIKGGMIPKLDNAFSTLDYGVKEVIITNANNLNDLRLGTHIHQ